MKTRDRVGEIYTEVVRTAEKVEEVFRYAHIPKKNQAEEESFFTRYVLTSLSRNGLSSSEASSSTPC